MSTDQYRPLDQPYRIDRWDTIGRHHWDIEIAAEMTRYHIVVTNRPAEGVPVWTFTIVNLQHVFGEFAELETWVDIVPPTIAEHTTFVPQYLEQYCHNQRTAVLMAVFIDDFIRWYRTNDPAVIVGGVVANATVQVPAASAPVRPAQQYSRICIAVDHDRAADTIHDLTSIDERYWWSSVLGPTSSFLLGRIFELDGAEVELADLGWEAGSISDTLVSKAMRRLEQFHMIEVHPIDETTVLVRPYRWMRELRRGHQLRAPAWWATAYQRHVSALRGAR